MDSPSQFSPPNPVQCAMTWSPGYSCPTGPDSRSVEAFVTSIAPASRPICPRTTSKPRPVTNPVPSTHPAGGTIDGYVREVCDDHLVGTNRVRGDRPPNCTSYAAGGDEQTARDEGSARHAPDAASSSSRSHFPAPLSVVQTGRKTKNTRPYGWGRVRLAPRKRSDQFRRRIKASPHAPFTRSVRFAPYHSAWPDGQ